MRGLVRRLRSDDAGFTLVELLVTMAILGTVTAAIAALFEAGIHSQSNLNARFTAQIQLNTALGKLRREAHNACGLSTGYTTSSITLDMPTGNPPPQPPATPCSSPTLVTWCTIGSGQRYKLYRVAGSTCTALHAKLYADYITTAAVFTSYTAMNTTSETLARLHVHFPIDVQPKLKSDRSYTLDDDIVLRNSAT